MPNNVVILGAGPAGLACAYEIQRNSDARVILLDKASCVGGMGASYNWKNMRLDYGPHTFHKRGGDAEQLVRALFADDPDALIEGRKNVFVYLRGKRFRYPLQVEEVVRKFNPLLTLRILLEFFLTSLFHAIVSIPIQNFEDWGRKRFGSTLYRLSFGNYTEKVWKTSAQNLSEKFASEKIQGFSFINLLLKILKIGGQVTEPYFQKWIYHKGGCAKIFEKMAEEIVKAGGTIYLDAAIESIAHTDQEIKKIVFRQGDSYIEEDCTFLVNTIPLQSLFQYINDVPFSVRNAAQKLRSLSLLIVNIEFAQEKISDAHWFYCLDNNVRFNRVTEQKNICNLGFDGNRTVLSFELTCNPEDDTWNLSDEEIYNLVLSDCKYFPFIDKDCIMDYMVVRVPNVYELYLKDFDRHLDLVISFLLQFKNLASIGRRGLFLQGDMHQAVQMGIEFARIWRDGFTRNKIERFYRKNVKFIT